MFSLLPSLHHAYIGLWVLATFLLILLVFNLGHACHVWWDHLVNYNEKPNGKKGAALRHGRWFVHIANSNRVLLSVEWAFFRKSSSGFTIGIGLATHDDLFSVKFGLGRLLWLSASTEYPGKWASWLSGKIKRKGEKYGTGRDIGFSIHDGAIWIQLWTDPFMYRSDDPWYVKGVCIRVVDVLLGKIKHTSEQLSSAFVEIPMPERPYLADITLHADTWKRPRWFAYRSVGAEVTMAKDQQIPVPGKGENSWDCGEDAIYSMGCRATTMEEAVSKVVLSVLKSRYRHGGLRWRPTPPASSPDQYPAAGGFSPVNPNATPAVEGQGQQGGK